MTDTIHIGIDPGKTGGIAYLSSRNDVRVIKMPETDYDIRESLTFKESEHLSVTVLLEKVNGMPNNGGSRAFQFGNNYGFLRGCISGILPLQLVSPQKWQKHFGLPTLRQSGDSKTAKKNAHKQLAQQLFPYLASSITHATADALLIALYSYEYNRTVRVKRGKIND